MLTLPQGPQPPFMWLLKTEPLEMPLASGCRIAVSDCGIENQGDNLEMAGGGGTRQPWTLPMEGGGV